MIFDLTSYQKAAAFLAGAALRELFPEAEPLSASWTNVSFAYEFRLKSSFNDSLLGLVQDKMRFLLKEEVSFRIQEMLPNNAGELFSHLGHVHLAEKAFSFFNGFVSVVCFKDFYDCDFEGEKTSLEWPDVIHLVEYEEKERQASFRNLKITGIAAPNKQVLKTLLERRRSAKLKDHRLLGERMGLFSFEEENLLWSPKGEALMFQLQCFWRKSVELKKFSIVKTPFSFQDFSKTYQYFKMPRLAEWGKIVENLQDGKNLCDLETEHVDQLVVAASLEETQAALISSLQFIVEIVNIFSFECQWCLVSRRSSSKKEDHPRGQKEKWLAKALHFCGLDYTVIEDQGSARAPRIEVFFLDACARKWSGPCLEFSQEFRKKSDKFMKMADKEIVWTFSLFGSLERFIALLLERTEGVLPLWLTPELVRIVTVGKKVQPEAVRLLDKLILAKLSAKVDCSEGRLSEKIRLAELAKVPFIVVLGSNEDKKNQVSLRRMSKKGKPVFETLSQELLIEELKRACREPNFQGVKEAD